MQKEENMLFNPKDDAHLQFCMKQQQNTVSYTETGVSTGKNQKIFLQ